MVGSDEVRSIDSTLLMANLVDWCNTLKGPWCCREYAELMVGFGLVGDAMKLFEELELWNNLIDCYW